MIARATNLARYSLTVRCLPAFALVLTWGAIGLGGATATGSSEDSCAAAACEVATAAATRQITATGVGAVRLGRTYASLRRAGLLGAIRPGCELGGPNTRGANLRAPLRGAVDYTSSSPRKVRSISIRGGATAKGVGIGATQARIKQAFPKVVLDRGTEEVFGITLAKVPKSDGGRLEFAIDTRTKKVTLIGIPGIAFCE